MRTTFFLLLWPIFLFGFAADAYPESGTAGPVPRKPNILFIVVDDLKPLLGAYGDSTVHTPNLDLLAEKGITFSRTYCQQAVCAPSRVSMFTGLRPDRTRVWDLKTAMRDENPDVVTLPGYLRANGYETAGFGKLIHGAKQNDPESWSIPYIEDRSLEYAGGFNYPVNGMYQGERIHAAMETARREKMNWREINEYLRKLDLRPSTECLDVPDDAYEDGAIAEAGLQMLEKLSGSGKPFFLALGFHKPHLPFVAPKKYWDLYDRGEIELSPFQGKAENTPEYAYHEGMELRNYSDIPGSGRIGDEKQRELIHGYRACVSYVDSQIGRVMDKLEELDLRENTVIVLWGDHGWHLGDHGLWCKHTNFEQSTRAPLIISAPDMQQGILSENITEFVDIFPTICDLAGMELPGVLEGTSLMPVLKGQGHTGKDYAISQYPRGDQLMGYSMRTERYRLTLWFRGPFRERMIVEHENIDAVEFYDYREDPMETISLVNDPDYSEMISRLTSELLSVL